MNVTTILKDTRETIKAWKSQGFTIGFVPTMGYLHEGHLSLIQKAKEENDRVVVSIFVNPMQFSPTEDLLSYPRDFERDRVLCLSAGVDLIFSPKPDEMYKSDFCSFVDMSRLTSGLCGRSRPTHFRGVCTIVTKLFHIIVPDRAYFGQKDAQQLAVIKRMVRDLDMDIEIIGCPIVREEDGLAKSSRNQYLNTDERRAALILSKALSDGKTLLEYGEIDCRKIHSAIADRIREEPLATIDYVDIVDCISMERLEFADRTALVAVAVYIGKTRLIDNFIWEVAQNACDDVKR